MSHPGIRPRAAALAAAALLALPASAVAREPSSGPTGSTATPQADCATVTTTNSPQVDKPASGKTTTLGIKVTNCGATTGAYDIDVVGTSTTVMSLDPFTTQQCSTPRYTAGHLLLKSRATDSADLAALLPYCGFNPWGVTATYEVVYDIVVKDAAFGTPLATTQSVVQHRGGV